MTVPFIAGAIILVVLISLVVSSISYSRQKSLAAKQAALQQCKTQAMEFLQLTQILLNKDESYELLRLLHTQALSCLKKASHIAPEDPEVLNLLKRETLRMQSYAQEQRSEEIQLAEESDEALKSTHMRLSQVSKALDILSNKGKISPADHQAYKTHIRTLQLNIDVASHREQAQAYAQRGDIVLYQTHLKQARDALSKSKLEFDGKLEQIKELSDKIAEVKRTNKVTLDPEEEQQNTANDQEKDSSS